jgi:hypothetical protein
MAITTAIIVGTAATAASAGMSFSQANKQKKLQREAERDAQNAMAEVKKSLDVNYYDPLGIQKEKYELERESLLSAGAQAIQAGVEGESRGVAPTAGRVIMAQNEAQAGVRTAMGQELSDLARLSATEESRLRDVRAQINLEEAAGAQMAARDAQEARAAAIAQGFESVQGLAQTAIQAAPLYSRDIKAEKSALSSVNLTPEQAQQFEGTGAAPSTGMDFSATGQMSNLEYRKFIRNLTPEQRQMLFQNPSYQQNYNPFNPF